MSCFHGLSANGIVCCFGNDWNNSICDIIKSIVRDSMNDFESVMLKLFVMVILALLIAEMVT